MERGDIISSDDETSSEKDVSFDVYTSNQPNSISQIIENSTHPFFVAMMARRMSTKYLTKER